MRGHDELRLDIPAYVVLRLGEGEREEVERHLVECEECRELEASFHEIASAIREGGEAIFEPHPEERVLREFAQGGTVTDGVRLERHLTLCATCRLEVDAWRSGAARVSSRRPSWKIAFAAGLLVGIGLAVVLRVSAPPPADEARRQPGPTPVPKLQATAILLRVLPPMLRGEERVARWEVAKDEKWIAVAVPVTLTDLTAESVPVRFELVNEKRELAASVELRAGEVRRHLAAAEAVSLLLPADRVSTGRYTFTVRAGPAGQEESLYRIAVEISLGYRQSPPATKAPQ